MSAAAPLRPPIGSIVRVSGPPKKEEAEVDVEMNQLQGAEMVRIDPTLEDQGGQLQTFFGNLHGLQSTDPLIDKEGNREKMEKAYKAIKEQFKKEGKTIKTIWPKSSKIDWVDEQGKAGFTELDSSDPNIQALRDIYRSDKTEGKNGKEGKSRYDVESWPCRPVGVRGDMNGPPPLQKETERLQKVTGVYRESHRLHAIADPKMVQAQKTERLRLGSIAELFMGYIPEMLEARRKELAEELAQKRPPPEREAALKDLVTHLEQLRDRPIDKFAVKWALTHPIPTGDAAVVKEAFEARVKELEEMIVKEKGESSKPGPGAHVIPGLPTLMKGIYALRGSSEDELQPKEREYIHDVAALGIMHSETATERYLYKSAVPKQKKDCLEQIVVKLVKAVATGSNLDTAIDEFTRHPILNGMLSVLPPAEQIAIKTQLAERARLLCNFANQLKDFRIRANISPPSLQSSKVLLNEYKDYAERLWSEMLQDKDLLSTTPPTITEDHFKK